MPLLSASNVSLSYGSDVILDGVTFAIEPGEKIGLIGRNGCGKTSLLRLLLGELTADSGSLQIQRSIRVGYLSQDPQFDPGHSVREAAATAFAELRTLHQQQDDLYHEMATAEGASLARLMRRQERLEAEIEAAGGYAVDHLIDATLHGLGFSDDQFGQSVATCSGGQLNRLGLVRLLLEAPDLLLLDEPTNHLDIDGRRWLEQFLAESFPGAVILVSHDRWLLDRVVSRILEVERAQLATYPGSFAAYSAQRRERQLTHARVYEKQLDHIRREQGYVARYKAGQRSRQARGRETRLERFKEDHLVEQPFDQQVMRLDLPAAPPSGQQVLIAEGLTKRYGDLLLFEDLELEIQRGDRIGIVGPNGIGKSTLIKCLLGDVELDAGEVRRGSRLNVGYYRQQQAHVDPSLTVWQYVQSTLVNANGDATASEQLGRGVAGAFLFSGDEQEKLLGSLSGGERSRAALAGLLASAHNVLVLDEPMNHLDIPSTERLEEALLADRGSRKGGFDGTLLLVTHDRALLQATCTRLIIFDGTGAVRLFEGTYSDWESRRERQIAAEPAAEPTRRVAKARSRTSPKAEPHDPMERLSTSRLEERIEQIESEIAGIDEQLLDPAHYTDGERCRQLQERRAALQLGLEPIEREWSRRANE